MDITRFYDLIQRQGIDLEAKICIVGAGSIGSYVSLALAKMGFEDITIYDDGLVEKENIGPQLYTNDEIGLSKVVCLTKRLARHANPEGSYTGVHKRITPENSSELTTFGIVISCLDSMSGRSLLSGRLYRSKWQGMFIDTRMSIGKLLVYVVQGTTRLKQYRDTALYTDDQAVQEPCTNKAVSYISLLAGGMTTNILINNFNAKDVCKIWAYDSTVVEID